MVILKGHLELRNGYIMVYFFNILIDKHVYRSSLAHCPLLPVRYVLYINVKQLCDVL